MNIVLRIVVSCLLLFYSLASFAISAESIDGEKAYKKAIGMMNNNEHDGIAKLEEVVKDYPDYTKAFLTLGTVLTEKKKDYDKAVAYFKSGLALARIEGSSDTIPYYLDYSIALAGIGHFNEAVDAINQYDNNSTLSLKSKIDVDYKRNCYQFGVDYAKKHSEDTISINPINLGQSVNTKDAEYYPSVSLVDSNIIYFTRKLSNARENLYQVKALDDTTFSPAFNISDANLNRYDEKGAISITQDGEWLLFAANIPGKGYGGFDIYIAYKTPKGWSEPVNLGPNVNSPYWESSPTLTTDKHTLYFSSDRPSGYGGKDIYVSNFLGTQKGKLQWSSAENLGPTVNSVGDEWAPFIHADNKTLYFSSTGLPGYGSADIFVTHLKSDNQWTTPDNLGYPINTIDHEGSFFVIATGEKAYFASHRPGGYGSLDLYRANLKKQYRADLTFYVAGIVLSADSLQPIAAHVAIKNVQTTAVSTIQNDNTGKFVFALTEGNNYEVTITANNYLSETKNFDLTAKENKHNYDNYRVTMAPVQKLMPQEPLQATIDTVNMQGVVVSKDSNKPIVALVRIINLDNNRCIDSITTDSLGNFMYALPTNNKYSLNVSAPGFL